ncbi:MAG: methyltransferase domain-containing protein [Thermodesulfobacteriota bacterium]
MVDSNNEFIRCWSEILVPKWNRFRHILSGNGAVHSEMAYDHFQIQPGDKVLDIGCGYGETCLEIGRIVGPEGEVLGLDCTEAFLDIANKERDEAGLDNVKFVLGDAQTYDLPENYYDVVYSRFGVMFFQNIVYALKNAHKTLKPGGKLCMIVWRTIDDNPCWGMGKEIALKHLPAPSANAQTCGPGPFALAHEETTRAMMNAAGFENVELFKRNDADIPIGTSMEEAIDFQLLVGPSGEIVREAAELGQEKLSIVRKDMKSSFEKFERSDGIYLPSSTWLIMARK